MPINNIIKLRRGNATDWSAINSGDGPTLNAGEPGFEIDSNILKIGDGSTSWKDLKPIGADQSLYKVKNTSGGIIYKGQVVSANGTVGGSDAIQVRLFIADGSIPEYTIMGLATQTMNNNDFGYVTAFGIVKGIDTDPDNLSTNICAAGENWLDGDILYASPTASGKLTKNKPQHDTILAIVLNSADNGSLFARPNWNPHLDDIHDVNTSGVSNNQYLIYNSGTELWTPTSSGIFDTLTTSGNVIFNEAGANVDFRVEGDTDANLLFLDASSDRVGIGTSTPDAKLVVNGDAYTVGKLGVGGACRSNLSSDLGTLAGLTWNDGSFIGMQYSNTDDYRMGLTFWAANRETRVQAKTGDGTGKITFYPGAGTTEAGRFHSNGYFGIGVTTPGSVLSLQRSDATAYAGTHNSITNNGIDVFNNQTSITNAFAGISFRVSGSGYSNVGTGSINLVNTGDGDGDLTFVTRNNGTSSEKLRITYDGKVGIGTTDPGNFRLRVPYANGNYAPVEFNGPGTAAWGIGLVIRTTGGTDGAAILFRNRDTKNWQIRGETNGTGFQITEDGGDANYGSNFGTPRVHISAGGNVAIGGITNPGTNLHVYGGGSSTQTPTNVNGLFVENNGTSNSNYVFQTATGSGKTFSITNAGYVGIGTTSPGSKLHVSDAGSEAKILIENETLALLQFKQPTSNKTYNIELGRTDGELSFRSTSGEKVRITEDGKFGIGLTDPDEKLEVDGNIHLAANGSLYFGVAGTNTGLLDDNGSNRTVLKARGNTFDIINAAGNAFSATLRTGIISGGSQASQNLVLKSTTGVGTTDYISLAVGNNGATEALRVINNGNVGIGTTTPSYKLQVNGSFGATTKSFRIDHPSRPNYTLEYGSLESPYHGVRLTGRGTVIKGSGTVLLPSYLKDLIHDDENINIQITNIKHGKTIYVDEIDLNNDQFTVRVDRAKSVGSLEFFWTFTGVRKDVDNLVVEQEK